MFTSKRKLIQFSYDIAGVFPKFWHVLVLQEFQEFQDQTPLYPIKWVAREYSCLIPAQHWEYFQRETQIYVFVLKNSTMFTVTQQYTLLTIMNDRQMTKHHQEQIYSMQKLPRNTSWEYNIVVPQGQGVMGGRCTLLVVQEITKRDGIQGTD